ncbi:2358_t:CDS:2, partial [Gigaspora rosea]
KDQETDAALPASSKKRKANDAINVASSARQQELPHFISRSEVYKSVNFGTATTNELLIKLVTPLNLPGELYEYLAKKKPTQDTPEKQVQTWFNGLMKKANTLWKSVTAVDTCQTPYLSGYMPDISIFSHDDGKKGNFLPERVHTILELKRPRNASGLTDEAKGQLLDY